MRLYRSHRTEDLADALAEVLGKPAGDPFAPEIVVVQSRGMARWLSMQLASRLGICANIHFEFPAKILGALTGGVAGPDPFEPEMLRWRLLAALPTLLGDDTFAALRTDCRGLQTAGVIDRRAFSLAGRLAELFDRYITWRPALVRAWDSGFENATATGVPAADRLRGTDDPGDTWQPALWRALRARLPESDRLHFAARAVSPHRSPPWRRLCLFGMPSLPPQYLEVLAALADAPDPLEVHLFVPVPTRLFAEGLASPGQLLRARRRGGSHAEHLEEGHPLVTGLGRSAVEFQALLETLQGAVQEVELPVAEAPPRTWLARLQHDIVNLSLPSPPRVSGDAPGDAFGTLDTSISLHACHSPMRQVEVLRDVLLSLFSECPALAPRDVAVLTPDIETFAPLIEAVFGDPLAHPRLPFQIADRAARTGNPWAEAMLAALALAGGRMPASAVLDLLALPPLQARYGLEDKRLSEIRRLVEAAGIRWGVDANHRRQEGQPPDAQNTWRFGLDRMLLGLASPDGVTEPFADVLPLPGMEGDALVALGCLVEAWDTLQGHLAGFREAQTLGVWVSRLEALLNEWAGDADGDPALQVVRESLLELPAQAAAAELTAALAPDALLELLTARLGGEDEGAAQAFLAGGITFCALVPMRSIPFEVVCLLGMDEGAFPRNPARPAYDLMARHREAGDRTPRDDDRYLFLEALLSARAFLRVFYTGFDLRTNARRPPSVVVEELLDVLRQMGAPPALECAHPLQPFSPRNFGRGPEGEAVASTGFDARGFDGACALLMPPVAPEPFLRGPLEASATFTTAAAPPHDARPTRTTLALAELLRFFESPVAWFVRERLGIRYPHGTATLPDREPLILDGLETYSVRDALLEGLCANLSAPAARRATRLSGVLPLGTPGDAVLATELAAARAIHRLGEGLKGGPAETPQPLRLLVGDVEVVGTITELFPCGRLVLRAGKLNARALTQAWVTHVFWQASTPDPVSTCIVGHDGGVPKLARFADVPNAAALAASLIELHQLGRTSPLRLFPATSRVYALARIKAEQASSEAPEAHSLGLKAASEAWKGSPRSGKPGDVDAPEVARIFGGYRLDEIDEAVPGLVPPDTQTFARLAMAFFAPMLAALEDP